jgi:hypothetical protein
MTVSVEVFIYGPYLNIDTKLAIQGTGKSEVYYSYLLLQNWCDLRQ